MLFHMCRAQKGDKFCGFVASGDFWVQATRWASVQEPDKGTKNSSSDTATAGVQTFCLVGVWRRLDSNRPQQVQVAIYASCRARSMSVSLCCQMARWLLDSMRCVCSCSLDASL